MSRGCAINLNALLEAIADLETGHPVEAVLARYDCLPPNSTAYEVVNRYRLAWKYLHAATSDHYKQLWSEREEMLWPIVKEIAAVMDPAPAASGTDRDAVE